MITKKLYLSDMYTKEATATVAQIEENSIILDQTVFYAEGGGQVGDIGFINDIEISNTIKKYTKQTKMLCHPDFPSIQVNTAVQHIAEANTGSLKEGDEVDLRIDWSRRYRIMRMHSAAHVVLHYAWQIFGVDIPVKGCFIQPEKGRLDLATKLEGTKIPELEELSNSFIQKNAKVDNIPLENEPEALYWICDGIKMPCGGTHVKEIGEVGPLKLKRRAQGKSLDRIYIQLESDITV